MKKVILGLGIFVALVLLIAAFLPSSYKVTRSVTVHAPVEYAFNLVGDFKNWDSWSPWRASDPEARYTYSEKTSGAGAVMSWDGEKVGKGQLTITQYKANELIRYELKMKDMNMTSQGTISFEKNGDDVNILWLNEGKFPWPHGRWFGFVMAGKLDKMVGDDFEKGLAKIKEITEAMPVVQLPEINVELKQQPMVYIAGIRSTVKFEEIGDKIGEVYGKIMEQAAKYNIELGQNPPWCIYHTFDETKKTTDMEPALIVDEGFPNTDIIHTHPSYEGEVMVVQYFGSYETMAPTYAAMEKWMTENNKKKNGSPWEVYITDPQMEPDTAKWQTDIYWPVK